ncbi:MAG: hypothetical protein JWM91_5438 [Rhodospirillales bacterium]|nr:hypothetical protein [Rhodospirillales bacterium]
MGMHHLPDGEAQPFIQMKDPTVALNRVAKLVRPIAAQETLLFEVDKARGERRSAEQAAREPPERAARGQGPPAET